MYKILHRKIVFVWRLISAMSCFLPGETRKYDKVVICRVFASSNGGEIGWKQEIWGRHTTLVLRKRDIFYVFNAKCILCTYSMLKWDLPSISNSYNSNIVEWQHIYDLTSLCVFVYMPALMRNKLWIWISKGRKHEKKLTVVFLCNMIIFTVKMHETLIWQMKRCNI